MKVYRSCHNCFWDGLCWGCQPSACKDHICTDDLKYLPEDWGNPINHPVEDSANKLRELYKYY